MDYFFKALQAQAAQYLEINHPILLRPQFYKKPVMLDFYLGGLRIVKDLLRWI